MPWQAIAYVSSGVTLIAFIIAAAAWVHRNQILKTERMIRLAPEESRAELIQNTLEFFNIDTSRLTREQKYELAIIQIRERAARFRLTAAAVIIIAGLAAVVSVFALWQPPSASNGQESNRANNSQISNTTNNGIGNNQLITPKLSPVVPTNSNGTPANVQNSPVTTTPHPTVTNSANLTPTPPNTTDSSNHAEQANLIIIHLQGSLTKLEEKASATKKLQNIIEELEKDSQLKEVLNQHGVSSETTDGMVLKNVLISMRRNLVVEDRNDLIAKINQVIIERGQ